MPDSRLQPIHPDLLAAPSPPRVLVIDDVEMNAELISGVIRNLGDVQTATQAQEGLYLAQHHSPDLIVLDILMPEMDGFAVLKELKNDPRTQHIPVILLTGISDISAEEVGLNMGAIDFIAKPFRAAVLLARVRNQLAMVRQRKLLELLSHSDGLTGIANRRYFNMMLSRELSRMQRHQQPLSVLLIDLDDFKAFNDFYGHLQGDECLQQIARALAQALQRPGDMVARYAGEEFACLLPDTPLAGAVTLAQALQIAVKELAIANAPSQRSNTVSVSIGVASTSEDHTLSSLDLLSRADSRLYRAKRSGPGHLMADM